MADRDFANEGTAAGPPRARRRTGLIIVLLFILVALAGSFGGGFWMGMQYVRKEVALGDAKGNLNETAKLKARLEMMEAEIRRYEEDERARQAALKSASSAVGELTFYKDLPAQKVAPKPLARPAGQKVAPSAQAKARPDVSSIIRREMAAKPANNSVSVGDYRLQVGSFQRRSDAEKLKQQLAGLNLVASVEQSVVPGLGLWYRVLLGPYASPGDAERDKGLVQDKLHITGLVIKK